MTAGETFCLHSSARCSLAVSSYSNFICVGVQSEVNEGELTDE